MRISIKIIARYLACALAASSAPLTGQTSQTGPSPWRKSTLTAFLERAQEANPELEAFRQHYEAALERVPQANSLPDPTLQITHFVESVQTRTGPQEQVLMLGQRLPWFGKLRERGNLASAEAEALHFAYQAQQLKLTRSVADAFYDYAFLAKAIALTEENLGLLSELEPIVEERVRGGGDLNPLLRLKVEMGKVNDRLRSLEEKRHAQSAQLAALLALPADTILAWPEWESPEAEPTPDSLRLVETPIANNPELAMLERKVASAAARQEIARLEAFPDVTLGVNYIRLGEPLNPTVPDAGQDPWGVTLSVNVPIWRGRVDAAKSEALASQRAAQASLTNRENQLKADLSATLSRLRDAERRLHLYGTELLDLARQALEISRTGYKSGRTGILEVIDSERSLLDLETQYWRAAADTWQARVHLQTLVNRPLFEIVPDAL
jgi:outer membrane protein TolC